jgi:acetyl-CoA carboxylase alpha subunit
MNLNYLDFEQPIAELEGKIEALESIKNKVDISQEIKANCTVICISTIAVKFDKFIKDRIHII